MIPYLARAAVASGCDGIFLETHPRPDEAAKTAAWSAFMADAEWSKIKRVTRAEHGLMVGEIYDRLLTPTDYSPASSFQRAF